MPLPGEAVQHKMAPLERIKELKDRARSVNSSRRAGVMALFFPSSEGVAHLILILRKTYHGVHSAQVGFPGGKLEDEDISIEAAALRETEEEVGVPRDRITVLKKLTEIYIPPSDFFVQPFMGSVSYTPDFIMQDDEVEALIKVPVHHFLDESILITRKLSTSYAKEIEVPAYLLNGHVVWGATAMMLSEVRHMLQNLS